MSRYKAALGLLVVGGLCWLVMAWPESKGEPEAAREAEQLAPEAPAAPPLMAAGPPRASEADAAQTAVEEPAEPAEAPDVSPETRAAAAEAVDSADPITGDRGPVAEYRALYESEARSFDAARVELALRDAFGQARAGEGLLRSISCRETICKLEMRWSVKVKRAYMTGITYSGRIIKPPLALSPVGQPDGEGVRTVEVFLKLRPPGEPEPSHQHNH